MKYIITESQYKLLTEEKILELDFDVFNKDWELLQRFLDKKGNPPYKIIGYLDLSETDIETLGSLVGVDGHLNLTFNKTIESLGNLKSVEGDLYLAYTNIESLGNLETVGGNLDLYGSKIESLGNLQSVGGDLRLLNCEKLKNLGNLESVGGDLRLLNCEKLKNLGNLQYVGGYLDLEGTRLSAMTTEEEIRSQVKVGGDIYS